MKTSLRRNGSNETDQGNIMQQTGWHLSPRNGTGCIAPWKTKAINLGSGRSPAKHGGPCWGKTLCHCDVFLPREDVFKTPLHHFHMTMQVLSLRPESPINEEAG